MTRITWTSVGLALAAALVFLASAQDSPAQRAATQPAATPASASAPASAALQDAWLSQIALDELAKAGEKGDFDSLKETSRLACLGRLCAGHLDRLQAVDDLWYVHRACQYLPLVQQLPDGAALVKVLLGDREMARLLYRALDGVTEPAKAIDSFHAVWKADPKAAQEYANLAVAFAVATPAKSKDPNTATLEESFRFYTDKRNSFRYDLKAMPFELSVYLADTRLNLGERAWARAKYANMSDPAKSYFELAYDYDAFRDGKPKKIEALPFTLPNLKQVGGVCIEQAYYSTQVCKSMGVPAAIVIGDSASGIGHAWVACLKITSGGKQVVWDLDTGRYQSDKFFVGDIRDPVTAKDFPDCELALAGAAALLPLQRREEADTATQLADFLMRQFDSSPDADRSALGALADAYNARYVKAADAKINIQRDMPSSRKLDASMAEDLLALALERNLAHKPAWELLITMRSNNQVPVEHLDRFFDVLVNRTAKDYADYSCQMILRIVPTIPTTEQRLKAYQKMTAIYARRPDLQAKILIAAGDEFKAQGNKEKALGAYQQAALAGMDLASVLMMASDRAEKLLVESGKRDAAIAMYDNLFSKAHRPTDTIFYVNDTAWYKLGQRLAALLKEAGKDAQSQAITKRIEGK
jgi:hypothetical protein